MKNFAPRKFINVTVIFGIIYFVYLTVIVVF